MNEERSGVNYNVTWTKGPSGKYCEECINISKKSGMGSKGIEAFQEGSKLIFKCKCGSVQTIIVQRNNLPL